MLGVIALAFLLAAPVGAEIFRYTDENGTVHFVSSEDEIPARYRSRSGRAAEGSIGRVDSEVVESTAPSRPTSRRLHELRRRNQPRKPPTTITSRDPRRRGPKPPGKEPRKYVPDCKFKNRNGRCGRRRTAEWDAWNRKRIVYEAYEKSQDQP
jgi:hypothetical protein